MKLIRTHLSNKQFDVYSADCPQAWNKHPNRTSIYKPGDFDYRFNSLGFRCDEFDLTNPEPVLFMGCSHTMGLGIPYTETWAYKLHDKIASNTAYWNIGFEKSSIDAQVLVFKDLAETLRPKKIFFLMPNLYRRFIVTNQGTLHYSPMLGQDKKLFDPKNEYETFGIDNLEPLLLDQTYAFSQVRIYLGILDLLAKQYNTTVYLQHWYLTNEREKTMLDELIKPFTNIVKLKTEWEVLDYARDKMHFGPKSHSLFADRVYKEINHRP